MAHLGMIGMGGMIGVVAVFVCFLQDLLVLFAELRLLLLRQRQWSAKSSRSVSEACLTSGIVVVEAWVFRRMLQCLWST